MVIEPKTCSSEKIYSFLSKLESGDAMNVLTEVEEIGGRTLRLLKEHPSYYELRWHSNENVWRIDKESLVLTESNPSAEREPSSYGKVLSLESAVPEHYAAWQDDGESDSDEFGADWT